MDSDKDWVLDIETADSYNGIGGRILQPSRCTPDEGGPIHENMAPASFDPGDDIPARRLRSGGQSRQQPRRRRRARTDGGTSGDCRGDGNPGRRYGDGKPPDAGAEAEIPDAGAEPEPAARQIQVQFDGGTVVYALNDSAAADALLAQLPLTVAVEDYSTNEKIFYPPQALDSTDAPPAEGGAGVLAYYAPWGDVVMFYDSFRANAALYELGHAVSGAELISGMSGDVTVEAAE